MARLQFKFEDELAYLEDLPFVIGVFADLSGNTREAIPNLRMRKFCQVRRESLDDLLKEIRPELVFQVRDVLNEPAETSQAQDNKDSAEETAKMLALKMDFRGLADFSPELVVRQVPGLRALAEKREALYNLRKSLNDQLDDLLEEALRLDDFVEWMASEAEGETGNWDKRNRLDRLIEDGRLPRGEHLRPLSEYWLRVFFGEAKLGRFKPARDLDSIIRIRIAEIDEALARQVDAILHAPEFQQLEASWRGLEFLLDRTTPYQDVIVRVLDASKEELSGDLRIFDSPLNSAVAKKILSVDWWHNGRPFSVLIGDYNCNRSEADVGLLADMAAIAERARAPFLSSAGPEFFCLEAPLCFGIFKPRLEHLFCDPVYRCWKEFRGSTVSTHCALVTPRMLLREPYRCAGGHDQEQFPYHEPVSDWDSAAYLWGNAAYALAVCLARAYVKHGWAVDIHGIETGGLLDGLPVNRFRSMNGDQMQRGPAEAPLSDAQDRELRKQGFAPLCGSRRTAAAVFFGVPSCAKPRIYLDQSATERAEYSIQLKAAFALDRFLQFLVVMCHRLPRSLSHEAIGSTLANWLAQYADEDEPEPKDEAAKPLRKGEVKVSAVAGVPNAMELTLSIEPRLSGAGTQAPLTASVMVRPGESGGWAI